MNSQTWILIWVLTYIDSCLWTHGFALFFHIRINMVHGFIWPIKSCMNSGFPRFQMPGQGAGSRPLRLSTRTGAKPHQDAGATPDAYRPRDMPVLHVSNSTLSTEPAAPETCRSLPRPHPQPELGRPVGSRRRSESLGRATWTWSLRPLPVPIRLRVPSNAGRRRLGRD